MQSINIALFKQFDRDMMTEIISWLPEGTVGLSITSNNSTRRAEGRKHNDHYIGNELYSRWGFYNYVELLMVSDQMEKVNKRLSSAGIHLSIEVDTVEFLRMLKKNCENIRSLEGIFTDSDFPDEYILNVIEDFSDDYKKQKNKKSKQIIVDDIGLDEEVAPAGPDRVRRIRWIDPEARPEEPSQIDDETIDGLLR